MCKKLIYLLSFVLVLSLVSSNVVCGIEIERRVNKSSDDCEEEDPGGDSEGVSSSDLEMPHEDPGTPATDKQVVGMRFEDITIPKGSAITNAYIEFECDETDTGTDAHVSLVIDGELSPDAATFAGIDFEIILRPRTTAKVMWVPVPWTVVSQKDQTPNIAAVIQEIVNQDGWKSGNALVIIISDNPDDPSKGLRNAEAYDGEAANAPLLHVEFTSKVAMQPEPADGFVYEDTWASLSWMAGKTAVSHDVYFGDNFDDVNDGTAEAFQSNQAATFFIVGFPGMPYPEGLVPGTTYYWRVDEVEADGTTIHEGPVWSFMVPPKTAYNPDPPDGARFIDPNVELSWTAGFGGKMHYVYFGDNFDDVNNAAGGAPQATTTYTPGPLELSTTYYWRVDEFDALATYEGDVWRFKTLPLITITDPNFVGWWKFDEGSGGSALDFSGHGNHGTLGGDPQWVDGVIGGALDLSGNDYVSIDGVADYVITNNFTVSAWIKTTQSSEGNVFASNTGGDHEFLFGVSGGNPYIDAPDGQQYPPAINDDQWHMLTYVRSGSRGYIYVDSVQRGTYPSGNFDITNETRWSIGQEWDNGSPSDLYIGMVDDARFYNVALTVDEIRELMRGDPLVAWGPSPYNNATVDVDEAKQPLSWSPGDNASEHDVYFGTDRTAVENADTSDTLGIYRGRQALTSYTVPEGLQWGGGPYYWRIDEYNTDGTISTGGIWSFSVADYLIVDDFEDYDIGDNQIWYAWKDGLGYGSLDTPPYYAGNGTGSAVGDETTGSYCEETIVHSGRQSMPYWYDNNKPDKFKYSEAEMTLSSRRDWTKEGVGVLTVWFMGNPPGFVEAPAGTYTINASGADIWGTADEFRYAFKQLSGAGTISAQVLSVENTDDWAKCGVMIRESLDPGSKFVAVYITPGNGCRFQARFQTDADATSDSDVATTEQMAITAPYWVKLERDAGGYFSGYYSGDGVSWQAMAWNPQRITMATNVYIGLALTSHSAGVTCEAKLSDVKTTGTVSPMIWTREAIGASMLSNDPEPMYVALNGSAVVYHDNPDAALIGDWTEWNINLQAFADQGVNLANVDRIAIGFGDKKNPQAGGSGKMYFDDIWLCRPLPEPEPEPAP